MNGLSIIDLRGAVQSAGAILVDFCAKRCRIKVFRLAKRANCIPARVLSWPGGKDESSRARIESKLLAV